MYYEGPQKRRSIFFLFNCCVDCSSYWRGVVSAYIVPTYLYGKLIPVPDIYKGGEVPEIGQKINITPREDISAVEAVAKKLWVL